MTDEIAGNISVAEVPATVEVAPVETPVGVEGETPVGEVAVSSEIPVTPIPEKDFLDTYIENNPTIENFALNPSLYAPQQQYQQPQQFQQQQFNPQAQQQYQQPQPIQQPLPASIEFNNDDLQKFIENDDWAGYAKAVAQKVTENISTQFSPDKFKEIAMQAASQQANQVFQQQNAMKLVQDIRTGVLNNLSKTGVVLSQQQQLMAENFAKTPAIDNYGQIVRDQNNNPISKLDKAYYDFTYKAQMEGKPITPFVDFSVKYLTQMASKAFPKQKSQVPNTQIRQTMNEIHAGGQPVVTQATSEDAIRAKINAMTPEEFEAYKNTRRKI